MHVLVYVWEHSQPLLQNRLINGKKLGRDEVLMARHMH